MSTPAGAAEAMATALSPGRLRLYDLWVHGLSNPLFWRCPTRRLREHYRRHLSRNHLEVGVGTGYLLAGAAAGRLALLDVHPDCLAAAARRLRAHRPELHRADLTGDLPDLRPRFASLGATYVLHCLPGPWPQKERIVGRLGELLLPGGVLFGATLLGRGTARSAAAELLMRRYNRLGFFCNREDDPRALGASLARLFPRHELEVRGCVALFAGWVPGGAGAAAPPRGETA